VFSPLPVNNLHRRIAQSGKVIFIYFLGQVQEKVHDFSGFVGVFPLSLISIYAKRKI
jgi:hypothetical protein